MKEVLYVLWLGILGTLGVMIAALAIGAGVIALLVLFLSELAECPIFQ